MALDLIAARIFGAGPLEFEKYPDTYAGAFGAQPIAWQNTHCQALGGRGLARISRTTRAMRVKIKRGLDLPVAGAPAQRIEDAPPVHRVAVLGRDYVGLKPTMLVSEGDRVKLGQPLFSDKKNPDVSIVSPAGGTIREIRRGARRVLQAVIIDVDAEEEEETFRRWPADRLYSLNRGDVVSNLLASGL